MSKYMKSLYISTSSDTTLELPVPFEVDGCVCGIIEMSGKLSTYKGDIFLFSDICEESITGETVMPVLQKIKRRPNGFIMNDVNHVIWLRLNRPKLSSIRFYIANTKGDIMSFGNEKLKCTLLLTSSERVQKNGKIISVLWLKEMFH